jgi:phosphoribosylformimino-5-aminoimidazole carboxamide ribotide isomerase
VDAVLRLAETGVATFEVTAIARDGLLRGPDLALYRRMVALGVGDVIASAGIASTADLRAIRDVGCRGAIVGRALYDGTLALDEALAESRPA